MTETRHEHTNRLAEETSPYLLQHAGNPVDWYPWGPEALERARREERPIFLSIGYSACHWCHVMERESFEDERIATLLNEAFVNVKVDREERPDLDDIYMKAVQAMTGSGGWPMSVFLTPDLRPFFGGTYFPPTRRYGMPSFEDVIRSVRELWEKHRDQAADRGRRLAEAIAAESETRLAGELDPGVLDRSLAMLERVFDEEWGGLGGAPKFPHGVDLRLALRHWRRTGNPRASEIALVSLDRMAEGGIYDHLGGGFARYSTDERWHVPHFEKMLYDNAILVPAYLEAFLATGEERHARVARETLDWALREMALPEGAFASSLDADSEGVEGKFYVWTADELEAELGRDLAPIAAAWYGATPEGNWEDGVNVLWRHEPAEDVARRLGLDVAELERRAEEARAKLLEARERRVRPGRDDKVLASWNGLLVAALAQGYQVLGEERWLDAARRAAGYVLESMRQEDGRLFATARGGRAHLNAYLDDYAFLVQGLLDLYESDFDERWLRAALDLNRVLSERFWDAENHGYFTTGTGHEELLARLKSPMDGALPSGNGVQALNLLRLAELTGDREHAARAESALKAFGDVVNRYPQAFSSLLLAVDFLAAGPREIAIAGEPGSEDVRAMLEVVRGTFLPQRVVALAHPGADVELLSVLEGKTPGPDGARAYVCRNYACEMPASSAEELRGELASAAR